MNKALNVTLWVVQGLLFAAFAMGGLMKSTMPIAELAKNMTSGRAPAAGLVRFIGVSELCGALGLLVPSLARYKPKLTPLAALGLVTVMVLAAAHHLMNGEANLVPINLVLGGLAAFIAWGRWKKAPIASRA